MKVTFDSNVWEKVVLEAEGYGFIKTLILEGKIQPYICEIAISLESIRKKERLPFWQKYEPKSEVIEIENNESHFHGRICFSSDNEAHPGLHHVHKSCLFKAKNLGFKILPMTNFGTVRSPEIPNEMKVSFNNSDEFWKYAERLSECSNYIENQGAGAVEYIKLKKVLGLQQHSVTEITCKVPENHSKAFQKSVAEWVDGDSLSAHYANLNDIFCTQDSGKNSGAKSVFHRENIKKVSNLFGIKVMTVQELFAL